MHVSQHEPGIFSWVDLATTDLESAKHYYSQMFGWDIEDQAIPQGGVYAMARLGGRSVCGMSTLPPGQEGAPPHWNSYVTVEDIAATCDTVAPLGGSILAPPFDVMDAGRMATIQDREGAVLSLWQPANHMGAEVVNEPNTFGWNELYVKDLDSAREFYSGLFGWELPSHDAMGNSMLMVEHRGREIGTVIQLGEDWGPVPAHWAVYFVVENCDAWVEKSKGLGGQLVVEPMEIPDVGRFAGVADPQGARLMVIQLVEQAATA